MAGPARVTVDRSAIIANARTLKRMAPRSGLLAVVKRDAYGHGAVEVARALRAVAAGFAVAELDEAIELREHGIRGPVLVLTPPRPGDRPAYRRFRLTGTISDARQLADLPPVRAGKLDAHAKFDTGMGRLGARWESAHVFAASLRAAGVRTLAGSWTHLAAADERWFTDVQLDRFEACLGSLLMRGIGPGPAHAANSRAVLSHPRSCRYALIRPGIALYGASPDDAGLDRRLRPAMRWTVPVLAVRDLPKGATISYGHTWRSPRAMRAAVLPVGYADGFSRLHSNRGSVLIRGRVAPVRGRVCMNLIVVDVTAIHGVRPGSEAVLIGRQGRSVITVEAVAAQRASISYEVLCVAGAMNRREGRHG